MGTPLNRVLLVVPSLGGGGAERATVDWARELSRRGCDVTLVVERDVNDENYAPGPEVDVVRLHATNTLATVIHLRRLIRRLQPRVLYTGLPHLCVAAALARWSLVRRPRLVVAVHNDPKRELTSIPNGRLWAVALPTVYRRAAAVVAVSNGVASAVHQQVRRAHVVVVPNPVPIDEVRNLGQREPARWPDAQRVVVSVGRLTEQKDHRLLIDAFAALRPECGDVHLVIVGDGPLRGQLASHATALHIADRVHLVGHDPNPFGYMQRAECLALSSRWEGFGMVLVESMVLGTPVIATDCNYGPREVLLDGKCGMLVPVGSLDDLTGALESVLVSPSLRDELSIAGLGRAKDFGIDTLGKRFADVLTGSSDD